MKESKWIENLLTNRTSKKKYEDLIYRIHKGQFRELSPSDSFKIGLDIVVIETKGNGKREVFQRVAKHKADTGKISDTWGDIFIYDQHEAFGRINGYPKRFKPTSHRILVDTHVIDVTND